MAKNLEKEKEKPSLGPRSLHNFSLPENLQWGNQKQVSSLKFSKSITISDSSTNISNCIPSQPNEPKLIAEQCSGSSQYAKGKGKVKSLMAANSGSTGPNELEAMREKLMTDLKIATDKMKLSVLEGKEKMPPMDEINSSKAWNSLMHKAESGSSCEGGKDVMSSPPLKSPNYRLRSLATNKEEGNGGNRPKFSLTLTKEEIESDILAMTGAKPSRKPKKRTRAVQKKIDGLFPGSQLSDVSVEKYKVPDNLGKGRSKGDQK